MKKIRIAYEPVQSGAVMLYTVFLDKALRSKINVKRKVTSEDLSKEDKTKKNKIIELLKKVIRKNLIMKKIIKTILFKGKEDFLSSYYWIKKINTISNDEIILIPHVVQNDGGKLNEYYYKLSEKKFIWVLHDLHPYHFPEQWSVTDLKVMYKRYELLSKKASKVIVHNSYTKQDVIEKLKISEDKIVVVNLPAFLNKVTEKNKNNSENILKKYNIKKPYALWASSSTAKHKNHENLINAWKKIIEKGNDINLVCTGSINPRWNEINKLIYELNLRGKVIFTNAVSDYELSQILDNAKLAICPTLFEGGGPVPAAEAVMAGIPLAVSNIPQAKQLFDDRDDLVTYFNPKSVENITSTVNDILKDYSYYFDRAKKSKTIYEKMRSWDDAANNYWKVIEDK